MNFRLFSHRHKLYTNSPLWPSNQRTWSDWALTPDGGILELIFDGRTNNEELSEIVGYQQHDKRNFSIEPWTGLLDINGKKIYRGDILGAKRGAYNNEIDSQYSAEVIWQDAGFCTKDSRDVMWLNDDVSIWKTVFVKGNIHNAEVSHK